MKVDEVLVSKNEAPFTKIVDKKYFVILPQSGSKELDLVYADSSFIETDEFNSRNADQLSKNELINQLKHENWLM